MLLFFSVFHTSIPIDKL